VRPGSRSVGLQLVLLIELEKIPLLLTILLLRAAEFFMRRTAP
jgi:hypothetical protein